jgi:hypothetical protein
MDQGKLPGFHPGPPPPESSQAVEAWNIMGGLNWSALPIVVELIGVDDVELLIEQLVIIRNKQK